MELLGEGVAFVPVRPPGHHAEADRAMGFCLLNNVAVSAAALAAKGHRVLIVDWDVHHGNGTQSIFWDDPRVLYVSTHQWPLFPGTGRAQEVGGPNAIGLTVNIPLPRGATGDIVQSAFEQVAHPVIGALRQIGSWCRVVSMPIGPILSASSPSRRGTIPSSLDWCVPLPPARAVWRSFLRVGTALGHSVHRRRPFWAPSSTWK